jgi:hypothetical protein
MFINYTPAAFSTWFFNNERSIQNVIQQLIFPNACLSRVSIDTRISKTATA